MGMWELSSLPGIPPRPSTTHLNINVLGYLMSTIWPLEPYISLGNTLGGITSYFSFTLICIACLKKDKVLSGGCHQPPNSPNRWTWAYSEPQNQKLAIETNNKTKQQNKEHFALFSFPVVSDVVHSGTLEGPVTWLDLTLAVDTIPQNWNIFQTRKSTKSSITSKPNKLFHRNKNKWNDKISQRRFCQGYRGDLGPWYASLLQRIPGTW